MLDARTSTWSVTTIEPSSEAIAALRPAIIAPTLDQVPGGARGTVTHQDRFAKRANCDAALKTTTPPTQKSATMTITTNRLNLVHLFDQVSEVTFAGKHVPDRPDGEQ
jgi:hypothetical protein